MKGRESDAKGFASSLWALAALDAAETAPEVRDGVIPCLSPCKPQDAPEKPRDGAEQKK